MTCAPSRSLVALLAALALSLPVSRAAAAGPRDPGVRKKRVTFAPLFDPRTRFKPKSTFKLRFRARAAGAPVGLDDISFVLRHGDAGSPLPVRELGKGVFEVPFTPGGPGQYAVVASIRGAPADAIAPVRLGVVGVAEGLIEEPPAADADVKRMAARSGGRVR